MMTTMTILDSLDYVASKVYEASPDARPEKFTGPVRSYPADARAANHILWMIADCKRLLIETVDNRERIMRHLGFCQGWLWTKGLTTIEELRESNRPPEE
jgi:hypothetical protein